MTPREKTMGIVIALLMMALYVFLYRKAIADEKNSTCHSKWWLKVLAIIACVILTFQLIALLFFGYFAHDTSKLFMGFMIIPIIAILLCIGAQAFLIKKVMNDDKNNTCESNWWLKVISVIGCIIAAIRMLIILFDYSVEYNIEYNIYNR